MTYVSTDEAAKRAGASFRQLDCFVRQRLVTPPTLAETNEPYRGGQGNNVGRSRRWRRVDVVAARTVANIIASDSSGRSFDLAGLASTAVYAWHGRAGFVVVALPDVIEPAADVAAACRIAETLTVATVVSLEDGSDG